MTEAGKAIVIGCHVNGLGVIRSLALKEFRIIAMFYDKFADFAQHSKYVYEKVEVPNPTTKENEFIDFLVQNSHRWRDALIIGTNDYAITAISKNKKILSHYYKILSADWDVLRKLIAKPLMYSLVSECEIAYPGTFLPKTFEELDSIKNVISYPCILKPYFGHLFFDRFICKVFVAANTDELFSKFKLCLESGLEVMVQEIIPGPDSNLYEYSAYVNRSKKISADFCIKKIRQNPPKFGVARVVVSQDVVPQMKESTDRIIRRTGFTGILHLEFKKDDRDRSLKLIEINARISRSSWLAAYCGVNFPWLAYMDLVLNNQIEIKDYKKNVYWIEASQDIVNSILHYRDENLRLKDYLGPYLSKDKTFADISIGDLGPFIKRAVNLLKEAL